MKVIVIGASGTIGAGVVEVLCKDHEIVTVGNSTGDYQVDLSNKSSIEHLFRNIGSFDAVICAAGRARFGNLGDQPDEDYALALNNKLMGQVNLVRVGQNYINSNGSFTLTSGMLSQKPIPRSASVSMVNAGVESFARAAALELPNGIRLNAVSPGYVKSADAPDHTNGMFPKEAALAYKESVEGTRSGEVLIAADFVDEAALRGSDNRPSVATGHLLLSVNDVVAAAERLVSVGVRKLAAKSGFAVLELRGGTHIVLRESAAGAGIADASFDLMYDEIEPTHALFKNKGFDVTDISPGRIHKSFYAVAPEGFRIQVLDSHVGDRVV